MFARTTNLLADPAKINDGIALVRDDVLPAVTSLDGCVGMSMFVERDSGRCIITTAWESEAALRATADRVRPLRDRVQQAMGSSRSDVDVWELAVVHRDHTAPHGACARMTWLHGDPGMADRAKDVFKLAVLPRVEELAGFCSGSLLINHETGRAVGTITFDSRAALDTSRAPSTRIRESAGRDLAATIDEVAEMEVALAHLHVPEMA